MKDYDFFKAPLNNDIPDMKSSLHFNCHNEIITSFGIKDLTNNEDLRVRSTKIVCTIGKGTNNEQAVRKMIQKGMDVARLNMTYFDTDQESVVVGNIRRASEKEGKDIALMVELTGPSIRILGF